MTSDEKVKKIFVYNDETMIRLMDRYWDIFEDATLVPDKPDPYWVVTMKRPGRRVEVVRLTPDDLGPPPDFVKQDQNKA
jgi:hypothetical protein